MMLKVKNSDPKTHKSSMSGNRDLAKKNSSDSAQIESHGKGSQQEAQLKTSHEKKIPVVSKQQYTLSMNFGVKKELQPNPKEVQNTVRDQNDVIECDEGVDFYKDLSVKYEKLLKQGKVTQAQEIKSLMNIFYR